MSCETRFEVNCHPGNYGMFFKTHDFNMYCSSGIDNPRSVRLLGYGEETATVLVWISKTDELETLIMLRERFERDFVLD